MFPTDIYVTASVAAAIGGEAIALDIDGGELPADLPSDLAAVLLSHVDYRSGRLLHMQRLTARLHAQGTLAIWDLSHSVGALPVHLDECDVDYAVGCTYKYLNAGPGAPAFLFVRDRLLAQTKVLPAGWFAHKTPFAMAPEFTPADDIRRMLVGTHPVVASAGLEASLDVFDQAQLDQAQFDQVPLDQLRAKSLALGDLFLEVLAGSGEGVDVVTPTGPEQRGSQLSLRHRSAYPIVRNLIARGVVGDFREPDVMRFGFAPLYTRYVDAYDAVTTLIEVVTTRTYQEPAFSPRHQVT